LNRRPLGPLAERVVNDLELRRIVEKLLKKRAGFSRIEGYLDGLEEGSREAAADPEAKKENAG